MRVSKLKTKGYLIACILSTELYLSKNYSSYTSIFFLELPVKNLDLYDEDKLQFFYTK